MPIDTTKSKYFSIRTFKEQVCDYEFLLTRLDAAIANCSPYSQGYLELHLLGRILVHNKPNNNKMNLQSFMFFICEIYGSNKYSTEIYNFFGDMRKHFKLPEESQESTKTQTQTQEA